MSRPLFACILVMLEFKPGDMPPSGYLEWHEWARVQERAKLRQRRCRHCGRWLYPQEEDAHAATHAVTAIAVDALFPPETAP
jgi:hypothetical protein